MNKNILTVQDYSVQLEDISSCKLYKLLDIANDSLVELRQEVKDTEVYIEGIKIILNKRGE